MSGSASVLKAFALQMAEAEMRRAQLEAELRRDAELALCESDTFNGKYAPDTGVPKAPHQGSGSAGTPVLIMVYLQKM